MAGESIKFNASINTAGFDSGAKRLQSAAASASASIAGHFGKIATAVVGITAAFIGVRVAVRAFSSAIDMGGKLNDLTASTGETAGNLSILQRAFQNAGAGADAVGPTINRLQRAIIEAGEGGQQQAKAFEKLGLNLEDIKAKTPTAQLEAVAKALQGVGNDSDRGAIAMQLLGRSGGELLPLLRAMGVELDVARGQLGGLPGVMDRANQAFDTISDNMAAIGAKTTEFAAGLLEKVAPALADLTTRLANIDAAGLGVKLSEYLQKTLEWTASTLGLGKALNQIEVAIAGITSGNFADGFKLMFLTAQETASNAINNIVAAGMAALQTIGGALVQLFSPGSTTMAFIEGAFTMLGANLAVVLSSTLATALEATAQSIPNLFRPIADKMADSFLPGLSFMGKQLQGILDGVDMSGVSSGLRVIESDSKKAVQDISNIMHYEAGNLKKEWADVGKAMPKNFAAAYKSNLASPLLDMRDLTAQTAQLMQEVAAATRSAAFDAEKFGNALAEARLDRLTGDVPSSPRPDNAPAPGIFGMDPKDIPDASPIKEKGKPKTAMDRIRDAAKLFDVDAMTEESRMRARGVGGNARADDLEGKGFHRSAAETRAREERRRERSVEKFEDRQAKQARREELEKMGPMERSREEQKDRKLAREQERMAKEGSKTEKEREREEKDKSGRPAGQGAGKTLSDLWNELKELNTKLPQNALS
jgi:hypothetical protein